MDKLSPASASDSPVGIFPMERLTRTRDPYSLVSASATSVKYLRIQVYLSVPSVSVGILTNTSIFGQSQVILGGI